MYRRIVVPLDGSELAESVFPHVSELAHGLDAEVRLLSALTHRHELLRETASPTTAELSADVARQRQESEADHLRRYLADAEQRLAAAGVERITVSLVEGPPAAAIIEAAREDPGATIVVMATNGRGGLGRLVLGSVADRVVQELRGVPVLLFRPEA